MLKIVTVDEAVEKYHGENAQKNWAEYRQWEEVQKYRNTWRDIFFFTTCGVLLLGCIGLIASENPHQSSKKTAFSRAAIPVEQKTKYIPLDHTKRGLVPGLRGVPH